MKKLSMETTTFIAWKVM